MALAASRVGMSIGTVIAGTYILESLLGRGGMGEVFLASHNRLPGKQVAIKFLHAELTTAEVVARFKREAQITAQLAHPNIVEVDDYNVTAEGIPYLILEYLRGESLAQRLRAGPLTLAATSSILRQIGSALAVAHRANIVHRDLKPANIYLVETEALGHAIEVAKVLDFGISKILGSETVKTQETSLLGTPQYMAPEQAMGQHSIVDERTDVFALGAIVYEMLCGAPAFAGTTIPEVVFKVVYEPAPSLAERAPELPVPVIAAIEKAMAKAQDARWPTVSAFVEALTGQPLATGARAKGTSLAPESGFEETVDSGNRVGALGTALGPAALTPSPPVISPLAATVASTTATGSSPPSSLRAPPAEVVLASPRRAKAIAIGAVGAGIAAIAIVALVLTRSPHEPARSRLHIDAPSSPLVAQQAEPLPADAPPAPPVDAAVAVSGQDAGVAVADGPAPVPPKPVPTHPPAAPEPPSRPELVAAVAAMQELADTHQWQQAMKAGLAVYNADGVGRAQRAKASLVLAMASCKFRKTDQYNRYRKTVAAHAKQALEAFCAQYLDR